MTPQHPADHAQDRLDHDGLDHDGHDHDGHDHDGHAQDRHDHGRPDWQERLRGSGYRLTPQRELILGAVEDLGHATPDEVLAEVRRQSAAVNVSTVYRTLEVLEEIGLVRHAHLGDRAPTYHSNTGHTHFHLVCRNCQRVVSVEPGMAATFIAALHEERAFTADLGHLTVHGQCVNCLEPPPGDPGDLGDPGHPHA